MVVTMLLFSALMPPPVNLLGLPLHPMQVLFLATAVARMSALIPLSSVREDISTPFTVVVRRLGQYAAVRVIGLTAIITRRKSSGDDAGDGLA
jgi:hypothetical protein